MADSQKRKAEDGDGERVKRARQDSNKKESKSQRGKPQWKGKGAIAKSKRDNIRPGDQGIFITCNRGREAKSVGEIRDLFNESARKNGSMGERTWDKDENPEASADDIESNILAEVSDMKDAKTRSLFHNVALEGQCTLFIRTEAPIEPADFVSEICKQAGSERQRRTRHVQRLVPVSCIGRATATGLIETARMALQDKFHVPDCPSQKFAIRVNVRNHTVLKRDDIIKAVAEVVGPSHQVDLTGYDSLILIEVYKNIIGFSVVGQEYETLRRFNLTELYDKGIKEGQLEETAKSVPSKDA